MKKMIIFWKPLVILMLSFALTGFLCSDDEKEKSCRDAAKNAVDIMMSTYSSDLGQICDFVYSETNDDDFNAACLSAVDDPATFRSQAIDYVEEWCKQEPWDQESIDCISDADNETELQDC